VSILGKTTGTFTYQSPPIQGRYHDGPVKCKPQPIHRQDANSTEWVGKAPCLGALLAYYGGSAVEFYRGYRGTPSEPLTLIKPGTDKDGQLLTNMHTALMNLHRTELLAKGVDPDSIAPPEIGLLGSWDASFTALYPGYFRLSDGQAPLYIIKPLPGSNIFIGNEAWSDSDGWAEGSLVLTERALYHHIHLTMPLWIESSYYTDKIINESPFTEEERNLDREYLI